MSAPTSAEEGAFLLRRTRRLAARVEAAGVAPGSEPLAAWTALRAADGRRATVIDLYRLVAAPRGLAPHQLPREERAALARFAIPIVWPGFALTLGSERRDPIAIVDYDPGWPDTYERWRARLSACLGAEAVRIEHVGSTSVPGLAAKPIVDVQVSVGDLEAERRYVPQIESAGVQLRSRDELHRCFRPFAGRPRELHVHVCAVGSEWEREHLLFRNYLRAHRDGRDAYASVKRAEAATWHDDGWAYTDAKSEAILDILERAERWAGGAAASRPPVWRDLRRRRSRGPSRSPP